METLRVGMGHAARFRALELLEAGDVDPAHVYRVDVLPFRFLRVHSYAVDADGRRYAASRDEVATERPRLVRIRKSGSHARPH